MTARNYMWRWSHVDESGYAEQYVATLNRSRADDDPAHAPNTMAWVDPKPGERLLEIGCGNGAVARAVARREPRIREVVATDGSAAMIAEARRQLGGRQLPVAFLVADAHALPFPEAAFDRVYAQEIFVILPDPHRAFCELARVTRPGGHICIWESDCDVRGIVADDPNLARRITRFVGDHEYNGAVARQLIGWCKDQGWRTEIVPAVGMSEDGTTLLATMLDEWLADAQQAGVVTAEEGERFRVEMHQRQEAGRYFSYLVNFRISAVRM
jgi:ubiquinone/menaquinone biosynthesis C-methylase UbiE